MIIMEKKERSKRLHLGKVAILTLLTLGFYWIYVAYNSLKFLNEHSKEHRSNRWLVLLLIIPFVNLVVAYIITRRVDKVIDAGTKGALVVVMLINIQMRRFIEFLEVQGLSYAASTAIGLGITVSVIVWLLVSYQKKINGFLEKKETRRRYSIIYPGEIAFLVLASILIAFVQIASAILMLG